MEIRIRKTVFKYIGIILIAIVLSSFFLFPESDNVESNDAKNNLEKRFSILSNAGTNSCGGGADIVKAMDKGERLQGSCCSPMNMHSYKEQIKGLEKYSDYDIIPPDPYNVSVKWAEEMINHNEKTDLTEDQEIIYNEATEISHEGGPCCCICWHWYAYKGLAKKLIIEEGFSSEEIAEVWDLSGACGGEDHAHHDHS